MKIRKLIAFLLVLCMALSMAPAEAAFKGKSILRSKSSSNGSVNAFLWQEQGGCIMIGMKGSGTYYSDPNDPASAVRFAIERGDCCEPVDVNDSTFSLSYFDNTIEFSVDGTLEYNS